MAAFEIPKTKDKENRRKHGMPLSAADYGFDELYFETVDSRREYGEVRLVAVGQAFGGGDKLLSVAYTWREQRRRFISVRQASGDERRRYNSRYARNEGLGGR